MTKNMPRVNRRNFLLIGLNSMVLPSAAILNIGFASAQENVKRNTAELLSGVPSNEQNNNIDKGNAMKIQYLEIVTVDVDAACALYSRMHGVTFGEADQNLGGARTANLADGGLLGIRAPLRDTEDPVVRPYMLVENIDASVAAADNSGAEIAMQPTEIAGYGQFAIVIQGGIESGLWQL